jgi:ribosomal protein S12 methylthiotransferase accessory factor YcaO
MKMRRPMLLLASVGIGLLPLLAVAQALLESAGSSGMVASATMARPDLTYTRPTEKRKIENYLFNAFGPRSGTCGWR